MITKQLYIPQLGKPMNSIAFASTSGTNLEALLQKQEEGNYKINAVFFDKQCKAMQVAEKWQVPKIYESAQRYCGKWSDALKAGNDAIQSYLKKCEEYETRVVEKLNAFARERGFSIDMIFLAGYMRIIREPLIKAFPDKIINVHPANLSTRDAAAKRKYTGDNAVLKAIASNEQETYSTVHLVTPQLDCGEMIVLSKPLEVKTTKDMQEIIGELTAPLIAFYHEDIDQALERFKQDYPTEHKRLINFCDWHQGEQKRFCDWPAFTTTAKMIAEGRIKLSQEKNAFELRDVYVDDKKMPYCGMRL
jgi:folate-dependent phosphoribosylglycinamide formyltransferase PurN